MKLGSNGNRPGVEEDAVRDPGSTMSKQVLGLTALLVAVAIALVLAGDLLGHHWLVYIFKPAGTIVIILMALSNWRARRNAYALWIVIGLLFSLCGDVALIWPSRYFVAGLVAFLFTHITYLVAFTRDTKFLARPFIWIIYVVIAATFYALLFPNLPSNLRLPVAVYAILLSSMAAQAMIRSLFIKTSASCRAAVGAIFFMLSDLLLSFDRFHTALLLAPVLILVPYYAGQWLIASSTSD